MLQGLQPSAAFAVSGWQSTQTEPPRRASVGQATSE
jgi:hypothetical protein